jgi:hypothetical protein
LNILNLSPLLVSLVDGSFADLEKSANVVPFHVAGQAFDHLFALVDGIHPQYSQFVKGIQLPVTNAEKSFTAWQEAAQKDIECAFGVLQGRFQVMTRPFYGRSLNRIRKIASACLILHNMCVSDRVMDGNVYAVYDPANDVDEEEQYLHFIAEQENNGGEDDKGGPQQGRAQIGPANSDNKFVQQHMLAQQNHWHGLNNKHEHA